MLARIFHERNVASRLLISESFDAQRLRLEQTLPPAQTECIQDSPGFASLCSRQVTAAFDGGTSNDVHYGRNADDLSYLARLDNA
jgi:hypothetical protein